MRNGEKKKQHIYIPIQKSELNRLGKSFSQLPLEMNPTIYQQQQQQQTINKTNLSHKFLKGRKKKQLNVIEQTLKPQ